jgi:FkbM family methyltransferase
MSIADRLSWYVNARRRARALGFAFRRRKGFEVPSRLTLNGCSVSIHCPAEHGCKVDFIGISLSDCYRLDTVQERDPNIRTVLDVGANCGWFSIAARSHFPRAQLHAYEPNPALITVLGHNAREVDTVVHPEGVGASGGTVAIDCGAESNQGRTVEGGDIPRVALGTAIERLGGTVDLAKIDCEGAEWSMLEDPNPWAKVRWLTMEYHLWARPGATHGDAASVVSALGFDVIEQQPNGVHGLLRAQRSGAADTPSADSTAA